MTRSFVIPKRLVWEAFKRVKANGGGAGVDQESIEKFEGKLGDNLYKLWSRMESGRCASSNAITISHQAASSRRS